MQPEQIKNAAAEVLTQIDSTTQPASEVLNAYTRARRYIGSKDRRQLSDLVWGVLRYRARILFAYPGASARRQIDAFIDQDFNRTNAPVDVQWEVPGWLIPHIPNAETELPALLTPAPIVLRANGDRVQIQQALAKEGVARLPHSILPTA